MTDGPGGLWARWRGVPDEQIRRRLRSLEAHLAEENPLLRDAVRSFERLDRVAYRMGLLGRDESFATRVPWWPLISVLGTFSAGKSTFINHYLGRQLQATGTQAVDDRFTVLCYSAEEQVRVLPGIALDSDPRFPFYQISVELEKVAPGEGDRVDAYLQLKTCPCERLRGRILIDSPGFDADAQRTATLRLTDHIIDLSDLVLVFFDARHPEPGAMRDTLRHLVGETIGRRDSSKFLYVLNQIDATAREDNPEEVVAAWQRALAQEGLTAGKFYAIYSPEVVLPIEDEALRARFERKRDEDLAAIHARIDEVSVQRAYRIVADLEKTVREVEEELVPAITTEIARWRRGVLWGDGLVFGVLAALLAWLGFEAGWLAGPDSLPAILWQDKRMLFGVAVAALLVVGAIHHGIRRLALAWVLKRLARHTELPLPRRERLLRAIRYNARPWRSIWRQGPVGWGRRSRRELRRVEADADRLIQALNDRYATPSGRPAENQAPDQDLTDSAVAGGSETGQETRHTESTA